MKKTFGILAVLLMVTLLAACGAETAVPVTTAQPESAPKTLATEAPETAAATEAETTVAPETTAATEPETQPAPTEDLVNGLRREFKDAMDRYEAFMDEYIAFMSRYQLSPTDPALAGEYAGMMSRYAQASGEFGIWNPENMSEAEYNYHLDVQTRVQQKLIAAGLAG